MKYIATIILLFSVSSFAATLTIRSKYPAQNVTKINITRTFIDEFGRLNIIAFNRDGCIINKQFAQNSGYSLGDLQILSSMDNVEVICHTSGNNEWGRYLSMYVTARTQ